MAGTTAASHQKLFISVSNSKKREKSHNPEIRLTKLRKYR